MREDGRHAVLPRSDPMLEPREVRAMPGGERRWGDEWKMIAVAIAFGLCFLVAAKFILGVAWEVHDVRSRGVSLAPTSRTVFVKPVHKSEILLPLGYRSEAAVGVTETCEPTPCTRLFCPDCDPILPFSLSSRIVRDAKEASNAHFAATRLRRSTQLFCPEDGVSGD